MSIAFDVHDQGVELQFAPEADAAALPPNRMALTGVNRKNILRMRGVAGGGALTAGRSGPTGPLFLTLTGVPQDQTDDGVDILPHEKLKLELARAFGAEIAQMGEVVQAIMAAIGPDSKLDAGQKLAVQDVVRDLITLKAMMNTGQTPPAQMVTLAQGLLEKLVATLQPVPNLTVLVMPPVLAQFVQKMVQQVAVQTKEPALTAAVARIAPLIEVALATLPPAPMPVHVAPVLSSASPWMPGLSQGSGVPLSVLMPAAAPIMAFASVPDAAPVFATPATPIATLQPPKIESVAPVAMAAAAIMPTSVATAPVVTVADVSRPVILSTPDAPKVAEKADVKPLVDKAPSAANPVAESVKPNAPAAVTPPPADKAPAAAQQVERQILQEKSQEKPAQPVSGPSPVQSSAPPPVLPAQDPPKQQPEIVHPRPPAIPENPERPPPIGGPIDRLPPVHPITPDSIKGPCGKPHCDCKSDFDKAIGGGVSTLHYTAPMLIAELGDKTATAILAKHGGDVQKAAEFVAAQKEAEKAIAKIVSGEQPENRHNILNSQTLDDAISRKIKEMESIGGGKGGGGPTLKQTFHIHGPNCGCPPKGNNANDANREYGKESDVPVNPGNKRKPYKPKPFVV